VSFEPANGDVAASRAYVEAKLGLQVWAHSLDQAIRAQPHEQRSMNTARCRDTSRGGPRRFYWSNLQENILT
jgi:hypothetical protein